MPVKLSSLGECYYGLPNGEMTRLNMNSVELTSTEELDEKVYKSIKEASFTTEIKYVPMITYYNLLGRYGVSNNWLKRNGIPMRRRWERRPLWRV